MKVLLLLFVSAVVLSQVCEATWMPRFQSPFFRRPKSERVSTDRKITKEEKQKALKLGPNVCPERLFLGFSQRCTFQNGTSNCTKQTFYRTVYRCCPGFALLGFQRGCPKELYTSSKNVIEVLQRLGLTTFIGALNKTGLTKNLLSIGPVTVFAPTNAAFAALGKKTRDLLKRNPKALSKLLLYHVVSGKIPTTRLEDESSLRTLNDPKKLRVNIFQHGLVITIQGARIVKSNQGSKSGIVHVIDSVMTWPTQSTLEFIKSSPVHKRLYKVIIDSDIKLKAPFTIFAPTDKAFDDLQRLPRLRSKECVQNLLKYHVIEESVYTTILKSGQRSISKSLEGSLLFMSNKNGSVAVNKVPIDLPNQDTTDGVVHVIGKVLVPNSALSLVEVAKKENATELVKLLKATGLDKALSGEKKFTLFAPSNKAIMKLSDEVKDSLKDPAVLKNVLLYHVVNGEVEVENFLDEETIPTLLQNKSIRVNRYRYGEVVTAQGSSLSPTKSDLKSCNGYVHVIDKVMLPPQGSILEIIEKDDRFSTLSSVLEKANLKDTLRNAKAITLFAPTNEAFSSLPKRAIEQLLSQEQKLKRVLKYHLFRGTLFSSGLESCYLWSMNRDSVRVRVSSDEIRINNVKVSQTDIGATNGVIHVIDGVLQARLSPVQRWFRFLESFRY